MAKSLTAAEFIRQSEEQLTIDVRSPKEYLHGHIPHAVNLPLFDDQERAEIGTLYKQKGRNMAVERGLEIVGPKMADFVRYVKPLVKDSKIYIHCWRGGMRSGSMAWLYDQMGYEVYLLSGGYKAYRNYVLEELSKPAPMVVVGGRTGSGKTEVLYHLREMGEQVIDLEALAHHKGSSYGSLMEPAQPTTEQFENELYAIYDKLDRNRRIWIEDESKNIGLCYIPNGFWAMLRQAPIVVMVLPTERRVQRLVSIYGDSDMEGLREATQRIEKRLGNEATKEAMQCLEQGNLAEVARITLRYYDKAYDYGLTVKDTKDISYHEYVDEDMAAIARSLITYADSR